MKRFLLFEGSTCYPCGGANDFVKDFDSYQELYEFRDSRTHKQTQWIDWYNVIDTHSDDVIGNY